MITIRRSLSYLMVWLFIQSVSIMFSQVSDTTGSEKEVRATREMIALAYPEGSTINVKLQGTARLPKANGEGKVQRKKGVTQIKIDVDEMKPAILFGGDLTTYVFWTVSPEGYANNVGEFILKGKQSRLEVTTPLETFGMLVTAEPHFLVGSPSRFVVLENAQPSKKIGLPLQMSEIKYRGFEGVYKVDRETLANLANVKGEVRADVQEARAAVRLAEQAKAEQFDPEDLKQARDALSRLEARAASTSDKGGVAHLGHETVRLAVKAQKVAQERSIQEALKSKERAQAEEISKTELRAAEQARQRKEAEERAQQAQQQAQQAQLQAQRTQEQAQQLASAKSEAEAAAARAREEADQARHEREEARARMRDALSQIVETRETARGLILNLPDILFDFNKATLHPQNREVLSKIAGILLVAQGYRLSIEGHTDNIGSEDYNQRLSERRAQAVADYLTRAGLSSQIITSRGFGKSQPIASNDTSQGRQKNRRVEIVIEEAMGFRYR